MRLSMAILPLFALCLFVSSQEPSKPRREVPARKSSAEDKGSANQNTTTPPPIIVKLENPKDTVRERQELEAREDQESYNRRIEIFTGALAGCGLVQLALLITQLCVMRKQGITMRKQNTSMLRQYQTMRGQSRVMEGQLEQMKSSGEQNREALQHASNQVQVLMSSATATIAQAEALSIMASAAQESARAAKVSADALMAGDRAWLLFDYIGPDSDMEIIKQANPSFAYKLKNHGRTPALLFSQRAEFCLGDINEPNGWLEDKVFEPFEMKGSTPDGSAVPPQQPITFRTGYYRRPGEGLTIDDALAKRLIGQEIFLWACGCVWYKTVHGGAMFYTRFAYRYGVYERDFVRGWFPGMNESI